MCYSYSILFIYYLKLYFCWTIVNSRCKLFNKASDLSTKIEYNLISAIFKHVSFNSLVYVSGFKLSRIVMSFLLVYNIFIYFLKGNTLCNLLDSLPYATLDKSYQVINGTSEPKQENLLYLCSLPLSDNFLSINIFAACESSGSSLGFVIL